MKLGQAITVWCAGAGVAGAYFPEELQRLTHSHMEGGIAYLTVLVAEATRRAEWRGEHGLGLQAGSQRRDPAPRMPEYDPLTGTLRWVTSVEVYLRLDSSGNGWEVGLTGTHITRAAVMDATRLRTETTLNFGENPHA